MVALSLLLSCASTSVDTGGIDPGPEPALEAAPPPQLRRLTTDQYRNSVSDLLGEGLVIPNLEPDEEVDHLLAVGATVTSVSPRGVEQYEDAAFTIAEQTPSLACEDTACVEDWLTDFGRMVWRRPLTEPEHDRLMGIYDEASVVLEDEDAAVQYVLAALLQSPHFIYRVEIGDGAGRLTGYEVATRLSFLFWNTTPDAELLDAAEAGELDTPEGVQAHAERLLADERSAAGVRAFFSEMWALYELDHLAKDPLVFNWMSSDLPYAMKEETLLVVEDLVANDGDYRDLFTTRTTWVDHRLAAMYNVRAPAPEGHGQVQLPADGPRAGVLGHAGILLLYAHQTSSSATLRGAFVRERLLCHEIPPPPADVDTSIPEASEGVTRRQRVEEHLTNPSCAGCHLITDPIGLGMENFDGIGAYRVYDNGGLIDASGDLDGAVFDDSRGLGRAVRNHRDLPDCFNDFLYRYATGHSVTNGEQPVVDWLAVVFASEGYSVEELMLRLVTTEAFLTVGEPE